MKYAVLFDIDGTLLDAGGAGQAAMEATVAEIFGETRAVDGIPVAGRTDRAIANDLFRYYDIPVTDATWDRYHRSYIERLPGSLKARAGHIYPGVHAVLESLAQRSDVLMGLLTGNFEQGAWLKLEHYGVRSFFGGGGFGDDFLDRDDVARAARRWALDHVADLPGERTVVIGDTPADIRCGRAIDAHVIAIATGHYSAEQLREHHPDHLITDWSAGMDVFRKILPA